MGQVQKNLREHEKYNKLQGESSLQKIVELAEGTLISTETRTNLERLREITIEEKAYTRIHTDTPNPNLAIAKDGYLTGQLALLDILLNYVKIQTGEHS